jgi:hypothetical protein
MKNGHGWRLRTVTRTSKKFPPNCTDGEIRACVYQIIICRFYGVFQHVRLYLYCNDRAQMILPEGFQVTASFFDELPFGIALLPLRQFLPLQSDP